LLLAAAGLHWWIAASRLADWLDAKNGREIMPGVTLSFASRHITGFPFSLDTQFHDVMIAVPAPHGPTRWQAEKFAMHALTYGRDETIFEAAGHQSLQWTRPDGVVRTLPFAVGSLRASAIVQKGALTRFDFDLVGFGSKAFTAQRLQLHARQNGSDTLQTMVVIDGMMPMRGSCGRSTNAALKGTITHASLLAGLLSGWQRWEAAVAGWRAAGGKLNAVETSPVNRLQSALSAFRAEDVIGVSGMTDAICGPR
jgi:hypothetical protein